MTYVEGFVTPVPTATKDAYLDHAREAAALLDGKGIRRMAEHWGDAMPGGRTTGFARAVRMTESETIVFSWFEHPDRATRDAANAAIFADPRMRALADAMPFDGARMIYGGFAAIVEMGAGVGAYVDGFVAPVPSANRDVYREQAERTAARFRAHGALRVVETWEDDVPDGALTDFRRAVQAKDDEAVVYSWIEWPDKTTRNGARAAMEREDRMTPPDRLPFDAMRRIHGGFAAMSLGPEPR